ncbi:hypothetical protein BGX31_001379, partial [Mortierella sp. GBA43]
MAATQSFRLAGTTQTVDVPCDTVDGQKIIFWEEIEYAFPGSQHIIKNGNVTVKLMRDSNHNRMTPPRIKHHPGVVLDVVLFSTLNSSHVESSTPSGPSQADATRSETLPRASIEDASQNTQLPTSSDSTASADASLAAYFRMLTRDSTLHAEIDRRLIARLSSASRLSGGHLHTIHAVKDGKVNQLDQLRDLFYACHEELKLEMNKNVELREQLRNSHDTAPSQPTVTLQKQVQAVLDSALLLNETAIPRLFIVLPQDTTQWDPLNLSANRFRLFFLCECGEYTKSPNSRILHHVHLADHKGYDLARPGDFFKEYGCHVLAIHRMIKLGIPVAGLSVPTLSLMVNSNMADQHNTSLDELVSTIDRGMDQVICLIEKAIAKNDGINEVIQSTESENALTAKGLCKLDTFLKKRDVDKVPGNLYKTITTEGHVRWVCHDHYNDRQHLKAVQALRNIVATSPRGSFDESIGRLDVVLSSREMADHLYFGLVRTQSVYDLKVELKWDTTYGDLKDLYEALCKTRLEALELGFDVRENQDSDIVGHGYRYDPILDIMRHPSIRTFSLTRTPIKFFTRPTVSIRDYLFDNLRHMEIDLISVDVVPLGLKSLVIKTPHLVSLILTMDSHRVPAAYSAIAKHQKCPIVFKNQWLRILPPPSDTLQPNTTIQDMTDMFRIHGGQIEAWDVYTLDWPDKSAVRAFAEAAAKNGSKLKDLTLKNVNSRMDSDYIESICDIVAHSDLCSLNIDLTEYMYYRQILEWVQWDHLRKLSVVMDTYSDMESIMDEFTDDNTEILNLEYFKINQVGPCQMTNVVIEWLQSTLSSAKLQHLEICWEMTGKQVLDLIRSMDLSRLEYLDLWTNGMSVAEVQMALDMLGHAPELQTLHIRHDAVRDDRTTVEKVKKDIVVEIVQVKDKFDDEVIIIEEKATVVESATTKTSWFRRPITATEVTSGGVVVGGTGLAEIGTIKKVDGVWHRTVQVLTTQMAKVDHKCPIKHAVVYYDEEAYDSVVFDNESGQKHVSQLIFDSKTEVYYVYYRWNEAEYKLDGPHETVEAAKEAYVISYKQTYDIEWTERHTIVSEKWTVETFVYEEYEEVEEIEEVIEEKEALEIIKLQEKKIEVR